jgi:hypothetical protein
MTRSIRALGLLCLLIGSSPAWASGPDDLEEALIGYSINPVTLNLRNKNFLERIRIGVGAYLVETMGCAGCHTAPLFNPGGNPFNGEPTEINAAAFLGGGGVFGPFVSRNLTPDKSGRPGGLTFEQFRRTMRTGVDIKALHPSPPLPPLPPGATDLLQVMPWPEYRYATADTLQALYEYLSVIPCLEGGPGQPVAPATRCK